MVNGRSMVNELTMSNKQILIVRLSVARKRRNYLINNSKLSFDQLTMQYKKVLETIKNLNLQLKVCT